MKNKKTNLYRGITHFIENHFAEVHKDDQKRGHNYLWHFLHNGSNNPKGYSGTLKVLGDEITDQRGAFRNVRGFSEG